MFGGASKGNVPQWNNNKTTEPGDWFWENGPEDTISQIKFSNVQNIEQDPQFISTSSWDSTVKVWEINMAYNNLQSKFQGQNNFECPVLGHCWSPDNSYLFGAWADNYVKMWDLKSNSVTKVGEHASCVKDVYFSDVHNIVVSTSWDGHMKFWDMKSSSPCFDINLEPFKIWSFSMVDPLLVGALSDNSIFMFSMDSIARGGSTKPDMVTPSPLKFQTRSVEAFPNAAGYSVTSIEGRWGIKNIDFNNLKEKHAEDFNFKCHRKTDPASNVYSVHMTSFNAKFLTFMTCGGDGCYFIWDKDKRKRLKSTMGCDAPITAWKMSLNSKFAAYAFGYDWAKGLNAAGSCPIGLFIHPTLEKEVKSST